MRLAVFALAGVVTAIAVPAPAEVILPAPPPAVRAATPVQYYYHRRYYRPRVYARPHYYGERGIYPRRLWNTPGFLRPRYDPRNGGYYCLDARFTVQNGVCRPYRGF